jgi:hypothetical protein
MNKDLVLKLIKVANNLDIQGHYKEAGIVDRVAEMGFLNYGNYNPQVAPKPNSYSVTGNYSDHIQRYKALVDNDDVRGATNYFNGVMRSNFTPQQKNVFRLQAERIRNESNFGEFADDPKEVMINGQKVNNYSLTDNELMKYLTKHNLYDRQYTRIEFDRRWNNLLNEIKNDFVLTPGLNKQLDITKKMIELKVR